MHDVGIMNGSLVLASIQKPSRLECPLPGWKDIHILAQGVGVGVRAVRCSSCACAHAGLAPIMEGVAKGALSIITSVMIVIRIIITIIHINITDVDIMNTIR